MNDPSSPVALLHTPRVSVNYGLVVRATFRTLAIAALATTGLFVCLDWTNFACLDDYDFRFVNESRDDCLVTPYYRSSVDKVDHLVVHGLQRGRFAIGAGQERVLRLETGDYHFSGAALECANDDTIRLVSGKELPSSGQNIILHSAPLYPVAPPEVVALSSRLGTWWPRARNLLFFVLTFSFPFVIFSAARAFRRAEDRAIDEARGIPNP